MVTTIKSLADTKYFEKSQKDAKALKYMRSFFKSLLKPGRAKPFTIRRATMYTCQYVFPATRGYPNGRPCIDDVYGLPDPDCPACNGMGHPVKSDRFREVRVMGMMAPMGEETEKANLFGKIDFFTRKLIIGLPIPPEYTAKFGLKPQTDVRDKNGRTTETGVFIGYRLEMDDVVVWDETYWDGSVERKRSLEYIVTAFSFDSIEIGYFRLLQIAICNIKNVDSLTQPQARFDR